VTDDETNKMNRLSVKKQCKQTAEKAQQTDLTMGILNAAVKWKSQSTVRSVTILSNTDKKVRGNKISGSEISQSKI